MQKASQQLVGLVCAGPMASTGVGGGNWGNFLVGAGRILIRPGNVQESVLLLCHLNLRATASR